MAVSRTKSDLDSLKDEVSQWSLLNSRGVGKVERVRGRMFSGMYVVGSLPVEGTVSWYFQMDDKTSRLKKCFPG